jgi:hypothetical protein
LKAIAPDSESETEENAADEYPEIEEMEREND